MPQSRRFNEHEIVSQFKGNLSNLLRLHQPNPNETTIEDVPLEDIIAMLGKEKHRDYAKAFDYEIKEYSRRVQAIHWELGGVLFWWDFGKLWAADGFDYTSFSNWGSENQDWLPYAMSQLNKFKFAYSNYMYRLNLPERHPELMQALLDSGNIDKPIRIATYMVEDNIHEWVPLFPTMSRQDVDHHAKRMKELAERGIEPRDMVPSTVVPDVILGTKTSTQYGVKLGDLSAWDFYGEWDPDTIVNATFETIENRRRIILEKLIPD